MNIIRAAVSGKRNRYRDGEYDLDLSYITPRIIAMAYPGTGYEGLYRNPIAEVARFLHFKHGDNFMVFNLSERPYDNSLFGFRCVESGFPDHFAPPVALCWAICKTMDAWLEAARENVAVVHCLAGKGRTGVIIACYLLYSGFTLRARLHRSAAATSLPPPPPPAGLTLTRAVSAPDQPAASTAAVTPAPAAGALSSVTAEAWKALAVARSRAMTAGMSVLGGGSGGPEHRKSLPSTMPSVASHGGAGAVPAAGEDAGVGDGGGATRSGDVGGGASASSGGRSVFVLPPPSEMAHEVLTLFKARRGEGVKYPSQERTVRYFARIVHHVILAEHMALVEAEAAAAAGTTAAAGWNGDGGKAAEGGGTGTGTPPARRSLAPSDDESMRLQAAVDKLLAAGQITHPLEIRPEAAAQLRKLKSLPMPKRIPVQITKVLLCGIPEVPGQPFAPVLQISTAPYQGAETKVIYNSAWHHPVPASYVPSDSVAVFAMKAVIQGDVLFQVRQFPVDMELFRFSFQTTFMVYEGVATGAKAGLSGVYRLHLRDLDMEKRKEREGMFPHAFAVDIFYTVVAEGGDGATGGGGEGGAGPTNGTSGGTSGGGGGPPTSTPPTSSTGGGGGGGGVTGGSGGGGVVGAAGVNVAAARLGRGSGTSIPTSHANMLAAAHGMTATPGLGHGRYSDVTSVAKVEGANCSMAAVCVDATGVQEHGVGGVSSLPSGLAGLDMEEGGGHDVELMGHKFRVAHDFIPSGLLGGGEGGLDEPLWSDDEDDGEDGDEGDAGAQFMATGPTRSWKVRTSLPTVGAGDGDAMPTATASKGPPLPPRARTPVTLSSSPPLPTAVGVGNSVGAGSGAVMPRPPTKPKPSGPTGDPTLAPAPPPPPSLLKPHRSSTSCGAGSGVQGGVDHTAPVGGGGACDATMRTAAAAMEGATAIHAAYAGGVDQGLLHSGYLIKRGKMWKTWKRRWFVLRQVGLAEAAPLPPPADPALRSRRPSNAGAGAPWSMPRGSVVSMYSDNEEDEDDDEEEEGDGGGGGATLSTTGAATLLYYYKRPKDTIPKGVIPLTQTALSTMDRIGKDMGNDPQGKTGGRPHCFFIRGSRTAYLQAESEEDLERWFAVMRSLLTTTHGGARAGGGRASLMAGATTPALPVEAS